MISYDVHQVDEESIYLQEEEEPDEETLMTQLLEQGEDAAFVQEFEEQILAACQESADLSACLASY